MVNKCNLYRIIYFYTDAQLLIIIKMLRNKFCASKNYKHFLHKLHRIGFSFMCCECLFWWFKYEKVSKCPCNHCKHTMVSVHPHQSSSKAKNTRSSFDLFQFFLRQWIIIMSWILQRNWKEVYLQIQLHCVRLIIISRILYSWGNGAHVCSNDIKNKFLVAI